MLKPKRWVIPTPPPPPRGTQIHPPDSPDTPGFFTQTRQTAALSFPTKREVRKGGVGWGGGGGVDFCHAPEVEFGAVTDKHPYRPGSRKKNFRHIVYLDIRVHSGKVQMHILLMYSC